MAKVFTITEGLENMGAIRTGGQGSVYKGKRIGEIYTAVKLLPTPIHHESADDKNFQSFQNEVLKLKKVNEEPNPNVVKILNSGITESGSFPFIEMEFIEGPDLEELLRAPHDPIFTIREVIKVADHLANALAHCHRVEVKHGDIKSNNVKFNIHTANYVLLDFGLAVMSDEERRTSLRHAGAIEFMAPEQNEGQMLYQTDVYSFGIILFELLAGTVPFPLKDSGETNRNAVMLSHLEAPVPDLMELRRKNMPNGWSHEKKQREMQVPEWLLALIARCLQKKPEERFSNGMELHDAIAVNSTLASDKRSVAAATAAALPSQNEIEQLKSQLQQYQRNIAEKDREISRLKSILDQDDDTLAATTTSSAVNISKSSLFFLIFLVVGLGAFAAYSLFSDGKSTDYSYLPSGMDEASSDSVPDTTAKPVTRVKEPVAISYDTATVQQEVIKSEEAADQKALEELYAEQNSDQSTAATTATDPQVVEDIASKKKYTLAVDKTYFHTQPDESTKRSAFLVEWNNAELTALDEKNGFIYVEFFNTAGQVTKGWLKKNDLRRIN